LPELIKSGSKSSKGKGRTRQHKLQQNLRIYLVKRENQGCLANVRFPAKDANDHTSKGPEGLAGILPKNIGK
jgi:hypothetical protein